MVGALWSYNGWFVAAQVGEEIRDPGRTLPRALIGSTVLVIALYLLVNAAFYRVLSPVEVASVPESASVAAVLLERVLGRAGAAVTAAAMMLSTFGTLHSSLLTTSCIPFAMGRDGLLPPALATVSAQARTPTIAVLLLGGFATAFALSGTFDILTDLIVFATLFFNALAVAAVYVLRRAAPAMHRPYRMWGYPVLPGVFIAATLALMVSTLIATPGRALAGVVSGQRTIPDAN